VAVDAGRLDRPPKDLADAVQVSALDHRDRLAEADQHLLHRREVARMLHEVAKLDVLDVLRALAKHLLEEEALPLGGVLATELLVDETPRRHVAVLLLALPDRLPDDRETRDGKVLRSDQVYGRGAPWIAAQHATDEFVLIARRQRDLVSAV